MKYLPLIHTRHFYLLSLVLVVASLVGWVAGPLRLDWQPQHAALPDVLCVHHFCPNSSVGIILLGWR